MKSLRWSLVCEHALELWRAKRAVACEQALHLGESRKVTQEQHAKGATSARGVLSWLNSLAVNGNCLQTKRDTRERSSPFAFGSRLTSRDSPKWGVCTQATGARHNLKACTHTGDHHSLFTPGPHYIYGKIKKYRRLIGAFGRRVHCD